MTRVRGGFFNETTNLRHELKTNPVRRVVEKPSRTRVVRYFIVQVTVKSFYNTNIFFSNEPTFRSLYIYRLQFFTTCFIFTNIFLLQFFRFGLLFSNYLSISILFPHPVFKIRFNHGDTNLDFSVLLIDPSKGQSDRGKGVKGRERPKSL